MPEVHVRSSKTIEVPLPKFGAPSGWWPFSDTGIGYNGTLKVG